QTRKVSHVTVSGLGFTPTNVWLDAASGAFFGSISGWMTVVPEGWEPAVAELKKAQDEDEARRARETASRLGRHPAGNAFAITGARLFDAEDAVMRPGMTVLVAGNRIVAVAPDGGVAIPENAERIDAKGRAAFSGI